MTIRPVAAGRFQRCREGEIPYIEPMAAVPLYDLTRAALGELVAAWGFPAGHARRLWKYLYRESVTTFEQMKELPPRLRARLSGDASLTYLHVENEATSHDGLTRKYLLGLAGSEPIETVLMQCRGRATACVSSQAGCALGCVFCATGQMGFARNLTTGEIVAQALHVDGVLRSESNERLRNIVVMGMGEPLLNYDAVLRALEILSDSSGLAIAAKRITISTVGVVPGIIRLADEGRPFSLAVSLHAATQAERAALLPAARTWPLEALLEACRYYTARLDRKIFFEWTIIAGENDSPKQAHALADLVRSIPAQINLIPLNPTAGYGGLPGRSEAVDRFQAILRALGLPTTVRQRRGVEIAAGCGQLAGASC
jgi:23S rRNA (adenine2503-C2)-methyltransferase